MTHLSEQEEFLPRVGINQVIDDWEGNIKK